MFTPSIYALISVVVVSLISLLGLATLSLSDKALRKAIFVLVSLAVGALFGDAFIHLIPEAYAESSNTTFTSLLIIFGFLLFFVFEKFFNIYHSHSETEEDCDCNHCRNIPIKKEKSIRPLGYMILFSDSVHNFIDGIIIGVSYFISIEVGIASTIAIALHEIPQEIGDFGILLHSGFSKAKALLMNFFSALSAIVGVLIVVFIGASAEGLIVLILPIAAGGFIYIAAADLVPELHKIKDLKKSFIQFIAMLVGIGAMLLLLFL